MRLLKLTLLLVLCACTHSVYAQRHYVGISALEVNYGLNIFGRNNTNLNLSVSKYRSRTTYWKIGLNYFEKSYNYSYESNTTEVPTIVSFSSTAKDYYIDAAYFKTVATNLSSLYFSKGSRKSFGRNERSTGVVLTSRIRYWKHDRISAKRESSKGS